jgi:hypothetical protein
MRHIIREATDTEFHPSNMDREEGFSLSISWKSLANPERMKAPFSEEN